MKNKKIFLPGMILLLIIQLCAALFFCTQKQGFHYDEYYSYYSSNVTQGLHPTDMEWKDTEEICSEFKIQFSSLTTTTFLFKCLITDLHVILNHNIYNVKKKRTWRKSSLVVLK